ncbi:uncharacterized protein LOC116292103 isoform X2 [Actinia tenebrosa]|uniref:Uncharacterized protein LOC116292103 isoform X2 n=1 Tax=Actinia tenebrosa TaxID=6105 RepID=A0A6P8HRA6_ACTTE|nr:uncharacterized protein LOC116292103 isoform X2 [Actinia tenebrosa]
MSSNKNKEDKNIVLKQLLRDLRSDFTKVCDLFERIIDFNQSPTSESAKRKLDLEIDRIKALSEQCVSDASNLKEFDVEETQAEGQKDIPEYDKVYVKQVNGIVTSINTLKKQLVNYLQEKSEAEENISKENFKLRLDLQKEQAESMHQRQNHDYAVTEKNTVLATCRKLEEQLEERSRQIQQLQREGTVSLWQREKAKLVKDINSNEEQLTKELKEVKEQHEEIKTRLNRRIQDLSEQVKFLKMERDVKNGAVRLHAGNASQSELEKMKQQLFMKDRYLLVAEGELQKQQKYYVGFLSGISRDFRIMLERQHLTVKDYNKDQKAFASMLNKMYVAVKEGRLSDFRATLPSHYLGINVELSGHPLGKKLSRPFMDLEKHLEEVENTDLRIDVNHPLLYGWREGKGDSAEGRRGSKSAQVSGVHPQLVDMKQCKPLTKETLEHFPEWSENQIEEMFAQFKSFDANGDFHLDTQELLRAIPDTLGRMATTEEIKEAMMEVDIDSSGTVDFYEFLCVARLISQGKGRIVIYSNSRPMVKKGLDSALFSDRDK